MLYIRPEENGYNAYNIYHRLLFSEEDCQLLFAFIESNTSIVQEKLKKYANSRIDPETLEILDSKTTKKLCADIKKEMERIHPCLASNHYVVLFSMLAEHLNSLIYEKKPSALPSIEDYKALLSHIYEPLLEIVKEPLPPLITPTSSEYAMKYYRQLSSLYEGKQVALSGLNYLENVRSEAERYIYWILDQSSIRFRGMERDMRLRLYSSLFRKDIMQSDMRFISHFYWTEPEEYNYYEHTTEAKLLRELEENISVAESGDRNAREQAARRHREKMVGFLTQMHSDKQEIVEELREFLTDETDKVTGSDVPVMFEEHRVDNLYQLIQLQLWLLTKSDLILKRCRHCGRLFIAERQNTDYCTRIMKGETEPCDVVGPKKSFARLMDTDRILKSYNRVYKTKYARVKRGTMSEEEWATWREEARAMLDRCRAGEVSEDDFETWLRADVRTWGSLNPTEEKAGPKKLGE